ncbi:MAG TPA: hypothetical protein VGC54_08805 [Planctomycetota bacterium]
MMSARLRLALLVLAAACGRPQERVIGFVREIQMAPGRSDLPVAVLRGTDGRIAHRRADGPPIRFLVFEREGDRAAYGVYGLGGAKNDLPVVRPLSGDAIAWPDRDPAQALQHLLEMAGLAPAAAAATVAAGADAWFGAGWRILFVLPQTATVIRTELADRDARGGGSR